MATENINSDQESLRARGDLNKERLQQKAGSKSIDDKNSKFSENLAAGKELDLEQLFKNKLREKQAKFEASKTGQKWMPTIKDLTAGKKLSDVSLPQVGSRKPTSPENIAPEKQPGAAQLLRKYQGRLRRQQEKIAASKTGQRWMPVMKDLAAGKPLSEISKPEMDEVLQDLQEDVTGEGDDPSVLAQTVGSLRDVAKERSLPEAIKQGVKTGFLLRKNIDSHRTEVFFIALVFALTKDLIDIGFFELISWIDWTIDLFIIITLRIFLFGKGRWKVRIALWIIGPLEMIPVFGFLPAWTCCVLYAWYKSKKRASDSKRQLEELNKQMKELTGSGGRGVSKGGNRRLERFREQEELAEETAL